jgi:hypothetical protein
MYANSYLFFVPNRIFTLGKLKTNNLHFKGNIPIKNLTMTFKDFKSQLPLVFPFKTAENKISGKKKSLLTLNQDLSGQNFQSFETKSGIKIIDFLIGEGSSPSWGTFVKVNYVSYVTNKEIMRKIESTIDRNEIFTYQHGIGEINLAFEEAIHSMKIGGKRRIIVEINSETNLVSKGPISSSSGIRQELKTFIKKNFKRGNLFLIYDIELVDVFSQKIL